MTDFVPVAMKQDIMSVLSLSPYAIRDIIKRWNCTYDPITDKYSQVMLTSEDQVPVVAQQFYQDIVTDKQNLGKLVHVIANEGLGDSIAMVHRFREYAKELTA